MVTSICLSSIQIFLVNLNGGGGERHWGQGSGHAGPVSYTHLDVYKRQFQNTVIDTGVGQVGRVLEFGQLQVGGDYHGPAATVAAVSYTHLDVYKRQA